MRKISVIMFLMLFVMNCYADNVIHTLSSNFYKRPNINNPNLVWTSDLAYRDSNGKLFTIWLTEKEYKKLLHKRVIEKYHNSGEKIIIFIEPNN